jgi:glycosyltransferase involved in cell wall biosynthesis
MAHTQLVGVETPGVPKTLHVLTLTPFYPVAGDDARGCFVAEPLPWLERLGVVSTVLAVQPFHRGRVRANEAAPSALWAHFPTIPGGFGLPASGAFLHATVLSKVRRIHRARPLNLIHAHAALPCGHAAALLSRDLGIPFVVTVHGLDAFLVNQVKGWAGQWCKRVCQWVYGSARRVICISEKVRDQVLKDAAANTAVIYNGVEPEMFAPRGEASSVILSVGNLIPIKGHAILLRAFAEVQKDFPQISCELVGEGPELSRLRELTAELGLEHKVRFLGRQSRHQVAEAMKRCMLFALPSRYEGLGCVYLEAMAAGKPAIACRGQGIEEIIQHGRNGWLVGPDDSRGLASAVTHLLGDADLRERIGAIARHTVLERFTFACQAEQVVGLYRGLVT